MLVKFDGLDCHEFEDLVRDLLRADGYTIESKAGQGGPDGGRDIIVSKRHDEVLGTYTRRYLVQCKHYKAIVNKDRVGPVENAISQHEADAYILAVSTRVSGPLMEMLEGISGRSKYKCQVLDEHDIRRLLMQHSAVFRQYFPDEWARILCRDRDSSLISKEDVTSYASETLKVDIDEGQAERLRKWAILLDVSDRRQLLTILQDQELLELIRKRFKDLLLRDPYPFEIIMYGIRLSRESKDSRASLLDRELLMNPDFLASRRILVSFDDQPRCDIRFDRVNQSVLHFRTYHHHHSVGTFSIHDANIFGVRSAATLRATAEAEFRLAFMEGADVLQKKTVAIDYSHVGFFQIFIRVNGADG